MGLVNALKYLDGTGRLVVFSIILVFPFAFADCWALSETFKGLDTVTQSILACTLDLLCVFVALVILMICFPFALSRIGSGLLFITFPVVLMSATVIMLLRYWSFSLLSCTLVGIFSGTYILFLILCLMIGNYFRKAANKEAGNSEHNGEENQ